MKTINEIISQEPVYLNIWEGKDGVAHDFEDESIAELNILFASYGEDCYEGDAWVLFEKEGTLYEVNGGHCSCYGLEGQWEPDEVNLKELENRLQHGTWGEDDWSGNNFKSELCEFLGVEKKEA